MWTEALTVCECVSVYRTVDPLCVYVYVYMCVSVPGAGTATGVCVSRQGVSGSARLRYKGPHNNPASLPLPTVPLSLSLPSFFLPFTFCIFLVLLPMTLSSPLFHLLLKSSSLLHLLFLSSYFYDSFTLFLSHSRPHVP